MRNHEQSPPSDNTKKIRSNSMERRGSSRCFCSEVLLLPYGGSNLSRFLPIETHFTVFIEEIQASLIAIDSTSLVRLKCRLTSSEINKNRMFFWRKKANVSHENSFYPSFLFENHFHIYSYLFIAARTKIFERNEQSSKNPLEVANKKCSATSASLTFPIQLYGWCVNKERQAWEVIW